MSQSATSDNTVAFLQTGRGAIYLEGDGTRLRWTASDQKMAESARRLVPLKDIPKAEKMAAACRPGAVPARRFAADGSVASDNEHKPGKPSVEPEVEKPAADGTIDEEEVANGAKLPEKYARWLKGQLEKMNARLQQQEQQLEVERGRRVDAERYSALSERRQRLVFELDEEYEDCRYSKMNEQQFASHLSRMEKNYQPIPAGTMLPDFPDDPAAIVAPAATNVKGQPEKYAKAQTAAFQICQSLACQGHEPEYSDVLAELLAGKTSEAVVERYSKSRK